MPASNATSRFSDRVENYVRYRPGYPPEVVRELKAECGLARSHVIADVASGTGIWTRLLLENGNPVVGVEPNAEMREAGERLLAAFPKFTSIAGTAEATTLADRSMDFVTAAQAAHWFDRERARHEFVRILKPGGRIAILDLVQHRFAEARELYADVWLGFSEVELESLLSKAGFNAVHTAIVHKETEAPFFQTVLATGSKS